ncbi:MAG: flagellar protein [Lachnospiraceae bacterium]|nr:flagellar protein [Lachnospiraceae bacterium]
MNARNCRRCGKIFNYVVGMPICPACKEAMEVKFQEVKEYVREHKGVGIREVAEACDVDPQQIRQWLRDDRLEMTEDSAIMLNCEGCGTPIRSGRFCDKCKAQMLSGLQQVSKSMRPAGGSTQGSNDPNGPRWRS